MASRALRAAVATVVVPALAAALLAPAASAHEKIVGESPSGSAKRTVRQVSILFSGPIKSGTLGVYGPSGAKVSKGSGGRDPRNVKRLLVPLKGGLGVGKYTARARWIGADGHHQEARFSFRLRK